MVKVVELPQAKKCTCYQCKSVLEYQHSDMQYSLERDYGGGCDRVARIVCPNCQYRQSVPYQF